MSPLISSQSMTCKNPQVSDVCSQRAMAHENLWSRFIPDGPGEDLTHYCGQALQHVCELSAASAGSLVLLPSRSWEPVAHFHSEPALADDPRLKFSADAGWPGWILRYKAPLLVTDCNNAALLNKITPGWHWHGPYTAGLATLPVYSQYLGAPLLVEQEVIGVIGVLRRREARAFMAVDTHSLLGMAQRVATVIDCLRLQQENAEQEAALQVFSEMDRQRLQGAHPRKLWQVALHQALRVLGCEAGHIRLKFEDQLVLWASMGYTTQPPSAIRLLGQGLSGQVAAQGRALYIGRTTPQRTACLPLMADGCVLGTLVVRKRPGLHFTDMQVYWLRRIADLLASSLRTLDPLTHRSMLLAA